MSDNATAPPGTPFDASPAAPIAGALGEAVDEFVTLTERKRDLERELRVIKDQIAPVEKRLLDRFSAEGLPGVRHGRTGRMVSITRQIWARAANGKAQAAEALAACEETAPFVEPGFNTNTLSAHFREKAQHVQQETGVPVTDLEQLLPDELRGAIALTEDHKLSVRS